MRGLAVNKDKKSILKEVQMNNHQQIIDNHNARIDAYKAKFNLDDTLHEILLDSFCEGVERELMQDLKGGEK